MTYGEGKSQPTCPSETQIDPSCPTDKSEKAPLTRERDEVESEGTLER